MLKIPFYSTYILSQRIIRNEKPKGIPAIGDTVHAKYFIFERKFFRKKIRMRGLKKTFSGICIANDAGSHRATIILRKALQNNVVEAGFNLQSPAILSVKWKVATRKYSPRKLFWLRKRPDRFSRVKINK